MVQAGGARGGWKPPLLRIAATLIGVGLLAAGLVGAREVVQSRSWASAPARIVISQRTGTGEHRSSLILAEYHVGDEVHQCGRVELGRNNIASDVDRFPVGAATTVYFDPARSDRCALVRSLSARTIALLVLGGLFLGLGVFLRLRDAGRQRPGRAAEQR